MVRVVDPFSDRERIIAEFQKRYDIATRLLGAHGGGRLIYKILHLDPSGWPVSAIANEATMSENTVRRVVSRNERIRYMFIEDGRVYLTSQGTKALIQVERETWRIAVGEQTGFSRRLIRKYAEIGLIKNGSKAATIRFDSLPFQIQ